MRGTAERCAHCKGGGGLMCGTCEGHGTRMNSEGRLYHCTVCGGPGHLRCTSCGSRSRDRRSQASTRPSGQISTLSAV
jgi:hypothetical protein